jgi:hypothetical protein
MNAQILIQAIIQQTMVFLAQLATAGGVRSPLASVANQVFLDLSAELRNQGLSKNVIADMFGMTLRTYHRRMRELSQSHSVEGHSIWEAVLDFVRQSEPASGGEVHQRFARDDHDVVAGALNDLVSSGLCYRTGRGDSAVYRIANESDFKLGEPSRAVAHQYLVWQVIYQAGGVGLDEVVTLTRLPEAAVNAALAVLLEDGRAERIPGDCALYTSRRIDVPVGQSQGWEAAVLDHFQAMVSAITAKLAAGSSRSARGDLTGGATYSLDLWPGHPLEMEAHGTLQRVRGQLEDLRARIDAVNAKDPTPRVDRLLFYFGQHLRTDRRDD